MKGQVIPDLHTAAYTDHFSGIQEILGRWIWKKSPVVLIHNPESNKFLSEKIVAGEIGSEEINETLFSQMLYTKDIPDPDLLIRTGGEFRISNFLLWQIAYTEIHVTQTSWPAFGKKELPEAIFDYQNRERRYGKISKQLKVNNG